MLDITQSFRPSSESLGDFFQRPGVGYYIPLYQRPYSWDSENIDQLMEDIFAGVKTLIHDDDSIHFMGTAILFQESNPQQNIRPLDNRALPSRIDNVIDGQQRISSLALLSTLLYERIFVLKQKVIKKKVLADLEEEFDDKLSVLQEFFSVNLKRGKPNRKPVIVRGSIDQWTLEGDVEDYYKSDLTKYIATFIESISKNQKFMRPDTGTLVSGNAKRITQWLNKAEKAHTEKAEEDVYPAALKIIETIEEKNIWSFPRSELKEIICDKDKYEQPIVNLLSIVIQYFALFHFLTKRCCLTLIEPVSENWAFDMFQSLNATGTPLTAIETFKPLVVNHFNQGSGYKDSEEEMNFSKVDELLNLATKSKKNRLTNEYLTALKMVMEGGPLSSQFSAQRSWLNKSFLMSTDKSEFVHRVANLAEYWENVLSFSPHKNLTIVGLEKCKEDEKRLTAFCALFLRDSGHKMANTILGRFYSMVLRGKEGAQKEYVDATKAIAAFFAIWRSALSNQGLDDVYRKLMKGDKNISAMSWAGKPADLSAKKLKVYLRSVLEAKEIADYASWKKKSVQNLRYDYAKHVCKFALFVAAHDTIADDKEPGLMKIGSNGLVKYMCPNQWVSLDFKTIEHIAPQKGAAHGWALELYDDDVYQRVGNLTLLPTSINASASNKSWKAKVLYFKHLSESDPQKISDLQAEAAHDHIELAESTIELLKNTSFKHHLEPIISECDKITWDNSFVEKRTERICEILWNRVHPWLTN